MWTANEMVAADFRKLTCDISDAASFFEKVIADYGESEESEEMLHA